MEGWGRKMSRTAAVRQYRGEKIQKDMEGRGIIVKAMSMSGLAEEAGAAYKDINEVIETMHIAGISRKVVQLKPLGNVKGAASSSYILFALAMLIFVLSSISFLT